MALYPSGLPLLPCHDPPLIPTHAPFPSPGGTSSLLARSASDKAWEYAASGALLHVSLVAAAVAAHSTVLIGSMCEGLWDRHVLTHLQLCLE